MDSIGVVLRQEREQRGLSIAEVAESTKITVHNLAAIEEGRFEYFPNRVYARAFLRDYANFLGLDSAALLDRYEQERSEASEPEIETPTVPRRKWRGAGVAALTVVVLAGMAGVAYVGWRLHGEYVDMSNPDASGPAAVKVKRTVTPVKPAVPKPDVAPEQEPSTQPEAVQPPPAQPAEPVQPPPPPDQVSIKLQALGNVWVSVKVDGETKLFTTIPAGTTTETYRGKKIEVRAGRANAVKIQRDGGELKRLGDRSIPQTQVYKPEKSSPGPTQ